MPTASPRLANIFQGAVAILNGKVEYTGSPMGMLKFAGIWSNGLDAQATLDALDNDAHRGERKMIISVIDYLQSMVQSIAVPVQEPTVGLYRAACHFLEIYHERVNNVARDETSQALGRAGLRKQLLEQFKQLFPSEGVAQTLLNASESIATKLYQKHISVDEEYAALLEKQIAPPVTTIADTLYLRVKEKVDKVVVDKGKRQTVTEEVVRVRPPSIMSSAEIVQDYTTHTERQILGELSKAFVDSRSKEELKYCDDEVLIVRRKRVELYVNKAYTISHAIGQELNSRQHRIKERAVAKARALVNERKAATVKAAFTPELWREVAQEYMSTMTANSLLLALGAVGFDVKPGARPYKLQLQSVLRGAADEISRSPGADY